MKESLDFRIGILFLNEACEKYKAAEILKQSRDLILKFKNLESEFENINDLGIKIAEFIREGNSLKSEAYIFFEKAIKNSESNKTMTEETLKCPFCDKELLEIDKEEQVYDCANKIQVEGYTFTEDCIAHSLYLQGFSDLINRIISIKQKAYEEGYSKAKKELKK